VIIIHVVNGFRHKTSQAPERDLGIDGCSLRLDTFLPAEYYALSGSATAMPDRFEGG